MEDKNRSIMGGRGLFIALLVISFLAGAAFVLLIKGGQTPTTTELAPVEVAERPTPEEPERPRLRGAIIIDDMGARMSRLRSLAELDYKVSVAVLPHLRRSARLAKEAKALGFEVLLHLPMEPSNSKNKPGKGALYTYMNAEDIRRRLGANLANVPDIVGVNNHMGSKFTEDAAAMGVVFEVLAGKGLFFVDSKTSSRSVVKEVAGQYGIKTVARDIFLDNEQDKEYINGQFDAFIKAVKRRGSAIAIGHPYPETLEVLKERQEELKLIGITMVKVSELLK
jgi:hypothetical protein